MSIQKKGITESTTKKKMCKISFNYDRTESDLSATKTHFLIQNIDSITNVFDTLQTDWIIKFGNGLLSLHYFFW
jgi:hypothetical protein